MRTIQKSQVLVLHNLCFHSNYQLKEAFAESDTNLLEKKGSEFQKRVLEPEIYTNDINMAMKDNAYKEAKKEESAEMGEDTLTGNNGIEHPRVFTYVLVSKAKASSKVFLFSFQ